MVYFGDNESPVVVAMGVPSGYVEFGFGGGKGLEKTGVSDSALTHLRVLYRDKFTGASNDLAEGSIVAVDTSKYIDWDAFKKWSELITGDIYTRKSIDTWSGPNEQSYELSFAGLSLKRVLRVSGDTASVEYQRRPFSEISTILSGTSYLRPDRESPRRIYYRHTENRKTAIGDRGEGTAWYLHENWNAPVSTFPYRAPTSDVKAAKEQIAELTSTVPDRKMKLCDALTFWLQRLGLLSNIETPIPMAGQKKLPTSMETNIGVNLRGRVNAKAPLKDLADLGFGVSQALPVLISGLATPSDGLFVVEQPEAELHPFPQSGLADFFCSMVKCGQSVLIETHSEEIFHRLRLRAEQDADLANKIAVYFIDAPGVDNEGNFGCKMPKPVLLSEGAEFHWPDGFLSNGIEIEQQIRAARVAKEQYRR